MQVTGGRRRAASAFAIACAGLVAACTPGQAPAPAGTSASATRTWGTLAFKPCSLTSPFATTSIEAQCTTLQVPEDAARADGRRIGLNIAWLPATSETASAADPVVFLAGGPGQAATEAWPAVDAAFAEVRKHRGVLLVDQRGTGRSHPLRCKDAEGNNAFTADPDDLSAASARTFAQACAAALDADPRHYTTTDAVRDLERVRVAVGAPQLNLVGGSYGTRVAQQYAATHPSRVRTVVLDGVVPNTLVLGSEHARNLDAALAAQFDRCQRLPACRARFGSDIRAQLRTLMQRLEAAPVEVAFTDPMTGAARTDTATSGHVAALTRMFAYTPQAAALLPLVLDEAQAGRYAPLMALSDLVTRQVGGQINHGMQLSVICAEDAGELGTRAVADADTVLGAAMSDVLVAQCAAWPTGTRPAAFRAPLKTDAPVLLLSGEFDPVTPPRYGEEVARHLPNGRHLVLRGQGHGTFAVGCTPKLLARFIDTADAKALDAKCLDSLDYVPPFTGFNGWEP